MDDEELERELEELEQEELDKELIGVKPVPTDTLPDVPSAEPAAAREKKKGITYSNCLKKIGFLSIDSSFCSSS